MINRDFYPSIPSRFENLLTTTSFHDELVRLSKVDRQTDEKLRTVEKRSKERNIRGSVEPDPMYSGILRFAPYFTDADNEQGTPWSEPLPDPLPSHEYFVSCEISQIQGAGPTRQLQGFATRWYGPPGWTWTDGLGSQTLYDESISNPLFIRRIGSFGATVTRKGFRVEIVGVYRP